MVKKELSMELMVDDKVISGLKGHVNLARGESVRLNTQVEWYKSYGPAKIMVMDDVRTLEAAQSVLLAHGEIMYKGKKNYGIRWTAVPRGSLDNTKGSKK